MLEEQGFAWRVEPVWCVLAGEIQEGQCSECGRRARTAVAEGREEKREGRKKKTNKFMSIISVHVHGCTRKMDQEVSEVWWLKWYVLL